MKSVLISIKPQWCEKICNKIGEKDGKPIFEKPIEVRKGKPSEVPFKAFIYCTKSDKYLLDRDSDGSMLCWDKKEHHYPFKYEKDHKELFNGKVIGEFICDKTYPIKAYTFDGGDAARGRWKLIQTFLPAEKEHKILFGTCLSTDEMYDYIGEGKFGYAWHISHLKIYDKPKELSEFKKPYRWFNNRPVESWCDNCCKICDEKNCKYDTRITRPPQSWMFVEEI